MCKSQRLTIKKRRTRRDRAPQFERARKRLITKGHQAALRRKTTVARSPPKRMFKNLYQLRLLDFFELTAATGAALYIYKSELWWDFEKNWIAGALAISAIVIWIATRLGKTTPTPGLFLCSYAGALYGLSDLSPWMVVFGRLPILETIHHLFPAALPALGLQEQLRVIALTCVFLAVPALFFGSTATSVGIVVSMIRKTWKRPTSFAMRTALIFQTAISLTFLAGLSYYTFRPQIRHVATIRIPIERDEPNNSNGQVDDWFRATSIIAWTTTENGNSLIAIRSDSRFFEYELLTAEITRDISLECQDFDSSRHYPIDDDERTFSRKKHLFFGLDLGHVHHWTNPEGRQILLVFRDSDYPPYQFFDAVTGERLSLRVPLPGPFSYIVAVSNNGRFALFRDSPQTGSRDERIMRLSRELSLSIATDIVKPEASTVIEDSEVSTPVDFTLIDLESLSRVAQYSLAPKDGAIIDSSSGRLSIAKDAQARRRQQFLLSSIDCIRGEYPGTVALGDTKDGQWRLSRLGLQSSSSDEKLIANYMLFDLHAILDPHNGRVALSATPNDNLIYYPRPIKPTRIPIVVGLLEKTQNGQITLFDPKTKSASTSWLRLGILKNHHPESAKFTENGRYLIIQDEDKTADLFHVFSIP